MDGTELRNIHVVHQNTEAYKQQQKDDTVRWILQIKIVQS